MTVGTRAKQAKLDGVNTADFRSVRITLIMLCSMLGRMESLHRVVAVLAKGESPTALSGDIYTCTLYRKAEALSSQILDPPRVLKSPHIGSTKNIRERPEAIANHHYRQVTEEHFRKAVLADESFPKRAAFTAIPDARRDGPVDRANPHRKPVGDGSWKANKGGAKSGARKDEKVAQKPAHHPVLLDHTESQEKQKALGDKGLERLSKIQNDPTGYSSTP